MHTHHHGHGSDKWWDFPMDRAGRRLAVGGVIAVLFAVVGTIVLWPSEDIEVPPILNNVGIERVDVEVTEVRVEDCFGNPQAPIDCETVVFELPDGSEGSFQQTPSVSTPTINEGDPIVVADQGDSVDPQFRYFFLDFQRDRSLLLLTALFAGAVVLLGRAQGVRSLAALFISFVILLGFTLPALLETGSPVMVAIVGSTAVAAVTLYLTHGVNHLTTVSLLGSLISLCLTGVLAWIFTDATRLTGLSDEDSLFLLAASDQVDLRGILLAGMIIGTIGVLDDVTVTQSAAVAEIHEADPTMPAGRLYRSALRVGRDHIGSTTNTLAFAYAGAALPLLLVLTQAQLNIATALTSEIIAIEIVRALVGGIGLVASVPITTGLAAWAVHGGGEGSCAPDDSDPATEHEIPHDEPDGLA